MSNCNPCGTTNHLVKAVVRQELEDTTKDLEMLQESLSNFTNSLVEILTAKYPEHYFNDLIVQLFEDYKPTILEAMRIPEFANDLADMKILVAQYGVDMDEILTKADEKIAEATQILENFNPLDSQILTTFNESTLGAAVRTQADKNREHISVFDFFTEEEREGYDSMPPGRYDASRPLQEFFDYISLNDVGTAYCQGHFATTKALIIGGATGCDTKQVIGILTITAINTSENIIEDLLTIQTGENFTWTGLIKVDANRSNAIDFHKRNVINGIRIGGKYRSTHSNLCPLIAINGFKGWGIILDNLTTGTIIEKIRVSRSGSGYTAGWHGKYIPYEKSDFTVSSTMEGSNSQRSILTLSNYIDLEEILGIQYVYISGELYWVDKSLYDADNRIIGIFPRLPQDVTTGELMYVFGGGFLTRGGDASVTRIGGINVSTSAICVSIEALYPPVIDALTIQENFMLMSVGSSLSSGIVGGVINEVYCENNTFDIVQATRYSANLTIQNTVALDLKKCLVVGNPRGSNDLISYTYPMTLQVKTVNSTFKPVRSTYASSLDFDISDFDGGELLHLTGNRAKTVNLKVSALTAYNLFNRRKRTLVIYDSRVGVLPDAVINAPEGMTINGKSSIIVSGYDSSVTLDFYLFDPTSISVNISGNKIITEVKGQKTYNPPIIEPATQSSTTVALTGAKVGDFVNVSFDKPMLGTRMWAEVTAEDEVTVYHRNDTSEAVDVATGILKVKII